MTGDQLTPGSGLGILCGQIRKKKKVMMMMMMMMMTMMIMIMMMMVKVAVYSDKSDYVADINFNMIQYDGQKRTYP